MHEVRSLFRKATLKAVDELSRPGILFGYACLFAAIVGKGTHFMRFCAKASVLADGLAVGGVVPCFAGDAEGLLRPPGARDEADSCAPASKASTVWKRVLIGSILVVAAALDFDMGMSVIDVRLPRLRMPSQSRAGSTALANTHAFDRAAVSIACTGLRAMVMFAKMLFPDFRGIHGAESCSGHSFFPIARFRG